MTAGPDGADWWLANPAATQDFGAALARALPVSPTPLVIHLEGDLGAGKTSLVRGLLAGLGHGGRVPSPTYTLVEPYTTGAFRLLHVDLYRLRDPAELDDLGLADDLAGAAGQGLTGVLLAEWPDRGGDRLMPADLVVALALADSGRRIALVPRTTAGESIAAEVRRAVPGGS